MQGLPKVILVDIIAPQTSPEESLARLNELESLVLTYGGFVIIRKIQRRQTPDYQTYIGKGKLQEIVEYARENDVKYIIINNLLKPQQTYNIERQVETEGIEVWDKIDLILKIFDKHATSREAKLQIELAGLKHLGPRIFKMGLDLMRQGGGIGTRGKGETNIEVMKRHIARRELKVRQELKKVEAAQQSQRNRRKVHHGFKTVAIVGYTNAGKSCLMVALTRKNVKVEDVLFATLDTRLGKLYLPEIQKSCLMSDTIGFIRDLPPELIEAFKSTLAETIHSDLILHVIDADDLEMEWKIKVVEEVLGKLGCAGKKKIYVFNKIDRLGETRRKELEQQFKILQPLFISAAHQMNLPVLKQAIAERLGRI